MKVYGALYLREDHSVDPRFVTTDGRHNRPFINLEGDRYWPHIEREDIIGFGQEELGDEAHIYVFQEREFLPNLILDDLEAIRDFFCGTPTMEDHYRALGEALGAQEFSVNGMAYKEDAEAHAADGLIERKYMSDAIESIHWAVNELAPENLFPHAVEEYKRLFKEKYNTDC